MIVFVFPFQPECPMLPLYCFRSWLCLCFPFSQNVQCCNDIELDNDWVCVFYLTRMPNAVMILHWIMILFMCPIVPFNQNAQCCHWTRQSRCTAPWTSCVWVSNAVMILHWIVIASVCPIQPECPTLYLGLLDAMYCTMDDLCLGIQCCHDIALDRDCVCVPLPLSTRMPIAAMILH